MAGAKPRLADLPGPKPDEFLEQIIESKGKVLKTWYEEYMKEPPSTDAFALEKNISRNRYPNILLYDHSRVLIEDDFRGDYYHASWVDSYHKKNGYILAQAPFDPVTTSDFWRMAFVHKPSLILVLMNCQAKAPENKKNKKSKASVDATDGTSFWPMSHGQSMTVAEESLEVKLLEYAQDIEVRKYELAIRPLTSQSSESSKVVKTQLLNFAKWESDKKMPDALLELRVHVLVNLARAETEATTKGLDAGPVIIVCPTGVHRAGTYCVLDVVLTRIAEEKKVGLQKTAETVRRNRYGCLTYYEHYTAIANLILKNSISSGLFTADALITANKRLEENQNDEGGKSQKEE